MIRKILSYVFMISITLQGTCFGMERNDDDSPIESAPAAISSRSTPAFQWDGRLPADHLQEALDLLESLIAYHKDSLGFLLDELKTGKLSTSEEETANRAIQVLSSGISESEPFLYRLKILALHNKQEIMALLYSTVHSLEILLYSGELTVASEIYNQTLLIPFNERSFSDRYSILAVEDRFHNLLQMVSLCKSLVHVIPFHTLYLEESSHRYPLPLLMFNMFPPFFNILQGEPISQFDDLHLLELHKRQSAGFTLSNLRQLDVPQQEITKKSKGYWKRVHALMQPRQELTNMAEKSYNALVTEERNERAQIVAIRKTNSLLQKKCVLEEWSTRESLEQEEAIGRSEILFNFRFPLKVRRLEKKHSWATSKIWSNEATEKKKLLEQIERALQTHLETGNLPGLGTADVKISPSSNSESLSDTDSEDVANTAPNSFEQGIAATAASSEETVEVLDPKWRALLDLFTVGRRTLPYTEFNATARRAGMIFESTGRGGSHVNLFLCNPRTQRRVYFYQTFRPHSSPEFGVHTIGLLREKLREAPSRFPWLKNAPSQVARGG